MERFATLSRMEHRDIAGALAICLAAGGSFVAITSLINYVINRAPDGVSAGGPSFIGA